MCLFAGSVDNKQRGNYGNGIKCLRLLEGRGVGFYHRSCSDYLWQGWEACGL